MRTFTAFANAAPNYWSYSVSENGSDSPDFNPDAAPTTALGGILGGGWYDVGVNTLGATDTSSSLTLTGSGATEICLVQQLSDTDYAPTGLVSSTIDGDGNSTSFAYNPLGEETSETDPAPNPGQRTALPVTNYVYDSLGDVTAVNSPLPSGASGDAPGAGSATTAYAYGFADPANTGLMTTGTDSVATWQGETLPRDPGSTTDAQSWTFSNLALSNDMPASTGDLTYSIYAEGSNDDEFSVTGDYYLSTYDPPLDASALGSGWTLVGTFTIDGDTGSTLVVSHSGCTSVENVCLLQLTSTDTTDANGNLISSIDANGNMTTYIYNSLGQPSQQQADADEHSAMLGPVYDKDGNMASDTDLQTGATTTYQYDCFGDQVSQMRSGFANGAVNAALDSADPTGLGRAAAALPGQALDYVADAAGDVVQGGVDSITMNTTPTNNYAISNSPLGMTASLSRELGEDFRYGASTRHSAQWEETGGHWEVINPEASIMYQARQWVPDDPVGVTDVSSGGGDDEPVRGNAPPPPRKLVEYTPATAKQITEAVVKAEVVAASILFPAADAAADAFGAAGSGLVDGGGFVGECGEFGGKCFAAGTPLMMDHGSKPIEAFRVGDLILSAPDGDPDAPTQPRRVEEVFQRVSPVIELRVGGRVIKTTVEHPFYVDGKGWTKAGGLSAGDSLRGHDGRTVAVESVSPTEEIATVYNLRIAEYHTYFVGAGGWGFDVWAHNADYRIPGGASNAADESLAAANAVQAEGGRGAASALETLDDGTFTGLSTGAGGGPLNPQVQAVLDGIDEDGQLMFNGGCAEPRAISNAIDAGANTEGGTIVTRVAGGDNNGTPMAPCPSCRILLNFFGISF